MRKILSIAFVCMYLTLCAQPFQQIQSPSISSHGAISGEVMWIDVNNDGIMEILYCGSGVSNQESMRILEYSNGEFVELTGTNFLGFDNGGLDVVDFNNDGFADLIAVGGSNLGVTSRLYTSNGDGTFNELSTGIFGGDYGDVCSADFNNDGLLDIVTCGQDPASSYHGKTLMYLQNGSGGFDLDTTVFAGVNSGEIIAFDADNDGDQDLLISGFDNNYATITKLYLNQGNATFSEHVNHGLPGMYYSEFDYADYDNDGDLDIVLSGKVSWSVMKTAVYTNDGNGTFSEDTNISLSQAYFGSVEFKDINNDGDEDIFVVGKDANDTLRSYYYENNGGTFSQLFAVSDTVMGSEAGDFSLGDFDNDGDLDLVVMGWDQNYDTYMSIYENHAPVCVPPINVQTIDVTTHSAALVWDVGGLEISWDIAWGEQGFIVGVEGEWEEDVTQSPFAIDNLQPFTNYEVYILSNCINDSTEWIGPYPFSTQLNVGVEEVQQSELSLYPNPSKGLLTIKTKLYEGEEFEANVFSTNGEVLLNTKVKEKIDLTSLQPGVYFVQLVLDHTSYMEKIIVE